MLEARARARSVLPVPGAFSLAAARLASGWQQGDEVAKEWIERVSL